MMMRSNELDLNFKFSAVILMNLEWGRFWRAILRADSLRSMPVSCLEEVREFWVNFLSTKPSPQPISRMV